MPQFCSTPSLLRLNWTSDKKNPFPVVDKRSTENKNKKIELLETLNCFLDCRASKGEVKGNRKSQQKDDFTRGNDIKKTCRGLPKRSEEFWFGLKCREGRRNSASCLHKLQSMEELWSRRADWLKENTQHRTFIDSWSFSATTRKDL